MSRRIEKRSPKVANEVEELKSKVNQNEKTIDALMQKVDALNKTVASLKSQVKTLSKPLADQIKALDEFELRMGPTQVLIDNKHIKMVTGTTQVEIDQSNIQIQAQKELKVECGTKWSQKSGTSSKIDAGTSLDVKSGAAMKIEAGGTMTQKAPTVKIN